ncbi:MAG: S8 family serine peptidase [Actinomycetota bacterium]
MRFLRHHIVRFPALLAATAALAAFAAASGSASTPATSSTVVGFHSNEQLAAALRHFPGARITRRLPHMKTVVVKLPGSANDLAGLPGISYSGRPLKRRTQAEPALTAIFRPGLPYEWQYVATRENEVPEAVLRAASAIKIAVVDTGLDVTHPDIAAKAPETWDVVRHRPNVVDKDGHGTFVSSLAAGSVNNNDGIAGFGGDARLLMVKAVGAGDSFSDVDEAAAIVYAVDHGANIINLSIGGEGTSSLEARAIQYAASHNVLLVAAAGNEHGDGNPIEYPAAALQPPGSKGQGGIGLSVAASTMAGKRASFSNTGSQISLAAPGDNVFGGVAASSPRDWWPRSTLPGSLAGLYGWSSGTSFSSPEVAGAAALVWAANPALTAQQVAGILKATASGNGNWTPRLGYGVIDVAAAVASASGQPIVERTQAASWLGIRRIRSRYIRRTREPHGMRLRRVRLAVHLRTSAPTVTPDYRAITLQIRLGGSWHRVARTTTRRGGGIHWSVGLRPGRYLLRAVYRGRWDLRSALRLTPIRVN